MRRRPRPASPTGPNIFVLAFLVFFVCGALAARLSHEGWTGCASFHSLPPAKPRDWRSPVSAALTPGRGLPPNLRSLTFTARAPPGLFGEGSRIPRLSEAQLLCGGARGALALSSRAESEAPFLRLNPRPGEGCGTGAREHPELVVVSAVAESSWLARNLGSPAAWRDCELRLRFEASHWTSLPLSGFAECPSSPARARAARWGASEGCDPVPTKNAPTKNQPPEKGEENLPEGKLAPGSPNRRLFSVKEPKQAPGPDRDHSGENPASDESREKKDLLRKLESPLGRYLTSPPEELEAPSVRKEVRRLLRQTRDLPLGPQRTDPEDVEQMNQFLELMQKLESVSRSGAKVQHRIVFQLVINPIINVIKTAIRKALVAILHQLLVSFLVDLFGQLVLVASPARPAMARAAPLDAQVAPLDPYALDLSSASSLSGAALAQSKLTPGAGASRAPGGALASKPALSLLAELSSSAAPSPGRLKEADRFAPRLDPEAMLCGTELPRVLSTLSAQVPDADAAWLALDADADGWVSAADLDAEATRSSRFAALLSPFWFGGLWALPARELGFGARLVGLLDAGGDGRLDRAELGRFPRAVPELLWRLQVEFASLPSSESPGPASSGGPGPASSGSSGKSGSSGGPGEPFLRSWPLDPLRGAPLQDAECGLLAAALEQRSWLLWSSLARQQGGGLFSAAHLLQFLAGLARLAPPRSLRSTSPRTVEVDPEDPSLGGWNVCLREGLGKEIDLMFSGKAETDRKWILRSELDLNRAVDAVISVREACESVFSGSNGKESAPVLLELGSDAGSLSQGLLASLFGGPQFPRPEVASPFSGPGLRSLLQSSVKVGSVVTPLVEGLLPALDTGVSEATLQLLAGPMKDGLFAALTPALFDRLNRTVSYQLSRALLTTFTVVLHDQVSAVTSVGLLEGLTHDLSKEIFRGLMQVVPPATVRAIAQGLLATPEREEACKQCSGNEKDPAFREPCSVCTVVHLSTTITDHNAEHPAHFYQHFYGSWYGDRCGLTAMRITSRMLEDWTVDVAGL